MISWTAEAPEEELLGTQQVITSAANDTSLAVNVSTGAVRTWAVELPNAQAAMDYSSSLIGTVTGTYIKLTNSCLSYCVNVLNAGGLDVPVNSSLGIMPTTGCGEGRLRPTLKKGIMVSINGVRVELLGAAFTRSCGGCRGRRA
jgi:hypothetical protein